MIQTNLLRRDRGTNGITDQSTDPFVAVRTATGNYCSARSSPLEEISDN